MALLLNPWRFSTRCRAPQRIPHRARPKQPEENCAPRILVVDDSLTTRSLEKSILEAHGFQVSVAVDGIEALEKLGARKFDLVITDVMMPRMDGMQLLDRIKAQKSTEHIPVIMVTSMEKKAGPATRNVAGRGCLHCEAKIRSAGVIAHGAANSMRPIRVFIVEDSRRGAGASAKNYFGGFAAAGGGRWRPAAKRRWP